MYLENDLRNPRSNAASLTVVLTGLFKSVALIASEAAKQATEIDTIRNKENSEIARSTAAEILKGVVPSLQAEHKQVSELSSRLDLILKPMGEMFRYLNTERPEIMTELRNSRDKEFHREVVHPLLRQLCLAAKEAVRASNELRNAGGCELAIDWFERFAANRQEALSTYGVAAFSALAGDAFDPSLHEVIRREKKPTDDKKLHGRIALEESPGFKQDEIVLTKSTVFLFEYTHVNHPAIDARG